MNENLTFNQVNEQESSAYRRGNGAKPSVLIERSDGRITVGNLDKHTGDVLFSEDDQNKRHPNVSPEKLSDQHQEMLAIKLAKTAFMGRGTMEGASGLNFTNKSEKERDNGTTLADIVRIYGSSDYGPGRLTAGNKRRLYEGSPLARQSQSEGRLSAGDEFLDNVIIVGDVTLGLTRTRGADGAINSTRLAVLPIGESAGSLVDRQSSGTLFDVDENFLSKPREDGAIKSWESFVIGREDIAKLTNKYDPTISREHLKITVMADGRVDVHDNSTNGTTILSDADLLRHESTGGFSLRDRETLAGFIQPLEKRTYLWNRRSAGLRVIDPDS